MYGELNNGRILTLFELGRWGLAVEMGLLASMRRRRAGFAVAGVSVRYRRRVRFSRATGSETRPLGWDERFLYIDQSMWMGETAANQMLLRAAIVGREGTVRPGESPPSSATTGRRRSFPDG